MSVVRDAEEKCERKRETRDDDLIRQDIAVGRTAVWQRHAHVLAQDAVYPLGPAPCPFRLFGYGFSFSRLIIHQKTP